MPQAGPMAEAMFQAIRRAEQLQALTIEHTHAEYTVPDKPKDLFDMKFEEFIDELNQAHKNGTVDQLNAKYAKLLMPFVQQILNTPQQQPQQ